ncbi:MAG: membrane dipeptidase [Bacteroidales bacterium]|jgi:microsomal dipeptidase-like Zn-dependent dipeptidase|nr:membrane dipeptidase [Bacteroidales bacterium]
MKGIYLLILYLLFTGLTKEIKAQGELEKIDSALWKKAIKVHHHAFIADAHAHQLVFNEEDKKKYHPNASQLELKMIEKGKIDGLGLFFAYYPLKDQTLLERVKLDIQALDKRIKKHAVNYSIISDKQDLDDDEISKDNFLILPGVEYFYGALEGRSSTIDSLHKIGIRAMTIMDNEYERLSYTNEGSHGERNINLLGKKTIHRMNDLGMLIDISHLDDQMQELVIQYSAMPVIASHSPVRAIHNVDRNIPDHILKQIAQKGGTVMITFNSGDLAGKNEGRCDIVRLIDHIDHAVKVMGIDHVGVGSDFNGAGLRSPDGLEDASGFPLITYHLLKRGYTEPEVCKIMGGNYLRLLKKVLPGQNKCFENKMVIIKGGKFRMGDIGSNGEKDEQPVHEILLDDFYISKHEVTQQQYEKIMLHNPSCFRGAQLPVDNVSWYDAILFCNKISRLQGLTPCYELNGKKVIFNKEANGYRLPTEAEWEYAARSRGRDDQGWSGTNKISEVTEYAWIWRNSGDNYLKGEFSEKKLQKNNCRPHPVGTKKPNQTGIFDMSGNVFEWCWDWYNENYYSASTYDNPTGPKSGDLRVIRGGQWTRTVDQCRTTNRFGFNPVMSYAVIGFRVVRNSIQ